MNIDTIANNLANVNTTGFKKSRVNFQDLLYETIKPAGTETQAGTTIPEGIQIGHGVRPSAIAKLYSPGNMVPHGESDRSRDRGRRLFPGAVAGWYDRVYA